MSWETAATQWPDQLEETRPPGAARPGASRLRSLAYRLPRGRRWLDGGSRRLGLELFFTIDLQSMGKGWPRAWRFGKWGWE